MARESPLMKFMYYNYPDVKYYPSLHLQARSGLRRPIPSFPGLCFSFLASAAPESLAAWGSLGLGSLISFFDPMGITSVVFMNKELRGRLRSISWYPVPIPNLDLLFCFIVLRFAGSTKCIFKGLQIPFEWDSHWTVWRDIPGQKQLGSSPDFSQ